MNRVFLVAASIFILITTAITGGIVPGQDQTQRNGYRPGVLIVKFKEIVVPPSGIKITKSARGISGTGIASVDALNVEAGVTAMGREEMYVPRNEALGRQLGVHRIYQLRMPEGSDMVEWARRYAADPNVESANPDWEVYPAGVPNDPLHANHWGHNNTAQMPSYDWSVHQHNGPLVGTVGFDANAHAAWDGAQGYGSSSVIIAIIDGGVNWSHPDLRIWQNDDPIDGVDNDANGRIDDVRGWDFGDNDNNPEDNATGAGHGTACSGVAAAIADNGAGVAGIAGGATIMPLKAANSAGTMFFSYINNAIYYAADNGADVISLSLGAASQDAANQTACTYAWNAGVVILAATGNENKTTISYPAGNTNVIAVGAASPCGDRKRSSSSSAEVNPGVSTDPNGYTCDGERWWGSNYGSTTKDASTAVDIIAPTILPTTDIQGSGGYDPGSYSLFFNGTSCSTPYAAGVCALIISANPTWTPTQVRAQLRSTAQDIVSVESGAGWDRHTGYGMVDAAAAVGAGGPVTPTVTVTAPNGGESWTIGTVKNITWGWTGTIASVSIDYSTDGGSSWVPVTAGASNTGTYSWTVPNAPTATARVRVSDASNGAVTDLSNANFTITSTPATVTLFTEGFEVNTVPGGPWTAYDNNGTSGRDYWGDKSTASGSRVHGGSWSAWCADNGRTGTTYDNNMNSYMAHSGINISAYTNVQVKFWLWYRTASSADYVSFQYLNGTTWTEFAGGRWSGSGTGSQVWAQKTFTVPAGAGTNLRFRWIFFANGSGTSEGAYVDDIEVTGQGATAARGPLAASASAELPEEFALAQNYPNPFNPTTTIRYDLPVEAFVSLKVYNALGQEVATLAEDVQSAGYRSVEFNAAGLPSGAYFYRITAGTFTNVKKFMLLK